MREYAVEAEECASALGADLLNPALLITGNGMPFGSRTDSSRQRHWRGIIGMFNAAPKSLATP
jgi:hypothetical protein